MQKKTVYLAGKITGDPFYRSKFYEAQKKLVSRFKQFYCQIFIAQKGSQ